jgi:hypothetical protein
MSDIAGDQNREFREEVHWATSVIRAPRSGKIQAAVEQLRGRYLEVSKKRLGMAGCTGTPL